MNAVTNFKFLEFDHFLPFVAKAHIKIRAPKFSLPCSQSFIYFGPKCGDFALPSRPKSELYYSSLRTSYRGNKGPEQCFRVPTISCLMEDSNGGHKEKDQSFSTDCQQEAVIDLKLPRRSLLVTFTCDACGARSQRLINRVAYERGLVYVQCSGCSQYHKLVDNLGLVIEYNLQEEIVTDANMDQV